MTFIGYLTEKKDENIFQKTLETLLKKFNIKAMVVAINEKNIENIKSIQFETVIMNRNIEKATAEKLKKILKVSRYLIINGDIVNMEEIQNINLTAITYGFGSKCTITASSINEDNMIFCLQRSICSASGRKIEPHERKITLCKKVYNNYIMMVSFAIELMYSQKNISKN